MWRASQNVTCDDLVGCDAEEQISRLLLNGPCLVTSSPAASFSTFPGTETPTASPKDPNRPSQLQPTTGRCKSSQTRRSSSRSSISREFNQESKWRPAIRRRTGARRLPRPARRPPKTAPNPVTRPGPPKRSGLTSRPVTGPTLAFTVELTLPTTMSSSRSRSRVARAARTSSTRWSTSAAARPRRGYYSQVRVPALLSVILLRKSKPNGVTLQPASW